MFNHGVYTCSENELMDAGCEYTEGAIQLGNLNDTWVYAGSVPQAEIVVASSPRHDRYEHVLDFRSHKIGTLRV